MEPCCLQFLAESCGAEYDPAHAGLQVRSLCTDTRQLQEGSVFVALKGERFDGHDFVIPALRAGAVAVVVAREYATPLPFDKPRLVVSDTRRALGDIAMCYRREFNLPLIAVGGSNGKTTTKEMIAAVLGENLRVHKSPASFNNDIGVPLSLLGLEARHQAAILEIGTNHPGELAPLVAMVEPQIGVITHIGNEHLEFFGSLDGVLEEEGKLAEALPPDGLLLVNGDDPHSPALIKRTSARTHQVGFGAHCDWQVTEFRSEMDGAVFFVRGPDPAWEGEYRIPLLGRHHVGNALHAVALGAHFGLTIDRIRAGLLACPVPGLRLEPITLPGCRILADCYNANSDSCRAALEVLADYPCSGRRIAMLGDMAELGSHARDQHLELGRMAAAAGIDYLIPVGCHAEWILRGACERGMQVPEIFSEVGSAARRLASMIGGGDVVLLKASRVLRMEQVIDVLRTVTAGGVEDGAVGKTP